MQQTLQRLQQTLKEQRADWKPVPVSLKDEFARKGSHGHNEAAG